MNSNNLISKEYFLELNELYKKYDLGTSRSPELLSVIYKNKLIEMSEFKTDIINYKYYNKQINYIISPKKVYICA